MKIDYNATPEKMASSLLAEFNNDKVIAAKAAKLCAYEPRYNPNNFTEYEGQRFSTVPIFFQHRDKYWLNVYQLILTSI